MALQGLQALDMVIEKRGGASVNMNDADRQIMKASAAAAGGMRQAHEEMAGFYCSNLVNTLLRRAYILIHKKLRYEMGEETGARPGRLVRGRAA